jgi:hypothetical protein
VLLPAAIAIGVWMLATGQHARFLFLDSATGAGRAIFAICLIGTVICTGELAFRAAANIPEVVADDVGVHVRRVFRTVRIPWGDLTAVERGEWKMFWNSKPTVRLRRVNGKPLTLMPDYKDVNADQFAAELVTRWTGMDLT